MIRLVKLIVYQCLVLFFRTAVIINQPKLAGLILNLFIREINPSGKYRVLCLSRSVFNDDVNALAGCHADIQYLSFPLFRLRTIVNHYADDKNLTEFNYYTDINHSQPRENIAKFIEQVFIVLLKKRKFDAVMTGNFGYVHQQEFNAISEKFGIPVIVLYKEGLVIQSYLKNLMLQYESKRFVGSRLLCCNNKVKSALGNAEISGLDRDKIICVGIPRLDHYFHEREREVDRQIVLFSFFPRDKFSYFVHDKIMLEKINQIADEFHRFVIRFAFEHPNYNVVIKTKRAEHYLDYVFSIFRSAYSAELPKNLKITNIADSSKLICQSQVILGLNSVTLIEGVIMDKMLISPDMSSIFQEIEWDYFCDHKELINYASSYENLENLILQEPRHDNLISVGGRKRFLKNLIYKDDGQASQRVSMEIINTLGRSRSKQIEL